MVYLMGNPHLHIAFIEEGSKLFAVPGLGIFAVLHVSHMEYIHSMRRPASAQSARYCRRQLNFCRLCKVSVSVIMHLNGSFIVLLSLIAPPSARRIDPQLLFRNGSIKVWDWSLPPCHSSGHKTAAASPGQEHKM